MKPVKLKIKDKQYLSITWDNGEESSIKLANLRKNCPCATCNAEREEQGNTYIPIYLSDQLGVSQIKMVGYYAIAVSWKDGHNTGIYEFDHLLELASKEK